MKEFMNKYNKMQQQNTIGGIATGAFTFFAIYGVLRFVTDITKMGKK